MEGTPPVAPAQIAPYTLIKIFLLCGHSDGGFTSIVIIFFDCVRLGPSQTSQYQTMSERI